MRTHVSSRWSRQISAGIRCAWQLAIFEVFTAWIVAGWEASSSAAEVKTPVPAANQVESNLQVVRKELFRADYQSLKSARDRIALSNKLYDQANRIFDDHLGQFAMLREARDLAVEAGDLPLAIKTCLAAARGFDLDERAWLADAVEAAMRKSLPADINKKIAEGLLIRIDDARHMKQFDVGARLAAVALTAARKSKDDATHKKVVEAKQKFDDAKEHHLALAKAHDTLVVKPNDPAANLIVGKALCFVEKKWPEGLACLAKGSDLVLRELAEKTLAAGDDPTQLTAAGDLWWSRAEKAPKQSQSKKDYSWGVAYCYVKALPNVDGITRTKLAKRIDDAQWANNYAPTASTQMLTKIAMEANAAKAKATTPAPPRQPQSSLPDDLIAAARLLNTPTPDAYLQLALWVFDRRGSVRIDVPRDSREVNSPRDLPPAQIPFQVRGVSFNNLGSTGGAIGDSEAMFLASIPWLTEFHLTAQPISDRGLATLIAHPALEKISVEYCAELTPGAFANLSKVVRLKSVALSGCKIGSVVADFGTLQNMTELKLINVDTQAADLGGLAKLTQLRKLHVRSELLTDAALSHLKDLTGLNDLVLDAAKFSDEGLGHLKGLTALDNLVINGARITDEGLVHLKGLINLTRLELAECTIIGTGLSHLEGCRRLQTLQLLRSNITNNGVAGLLQLSQVDTLVLEGALITQSGVDQLVGMKNVRNLVLAGRNVNDTSVPPLRQMTQLRELNIRGTGISSSGRRVLQASLPQCKVEPNQ